jgi:hypothetical protein
MKIVRFIYAGFKRIIAQEGFEVLTTVSTKMAVFWVVALCSDKIALMMEAARTSETLVNWYQTTQRYNAEDSHLRIIFLLIAKNSPPFMEP